MKPDTIVALASGAGRAGVAIVRLSGPQAGVALAMIAGGPLPPPREATLRTLRGLPDDDLERPEIDTALVLWFREGSSFTGEAVAEFHVHGGPAVVAKLIETCLSVPGVRAAEPGEFTRRAFENGKLDLAQAEGLADLVDAETEDQRRQALRQMQGALSALYEDWRARLVSAMALLEAAIDFPDEDLPADLAARVAPLLDALSSDLQGHLRDSHRGERVRDGYRIAIIGAPNAGKSSLLNALARREAAIVSELPGTTRDVVEIRVVLGGFPVWIADTAGLREAADAIEAEGVRRALTRAEEADLRLGLVEAGAEIDASLQAALRPGDLLLRSKADLEKPAGPGVLVSAKTGEGLSELEDALSERVQALLGHSEAPALTRARHRRLVEDALASIHRAQDALSLGAELAAEDLRVAASALGRITGRIDVEDLLDQIFSSFCIGK